MWKGLGGAGVAGGAGGAGGDVGNGRASKGRSAPSTPGRASLWRQQGQRKDCSRQRTQGNHVSVEWRLFGVQWGPHGSHPGEGRRAPSKALPWQRSGRWDRQGPVCARARVCVCVCVCEGVGRMLSEVTCQRLLLALRF